MHGNASPDPDDSDTRTVPRPLAAAVVLLLLAGLLAVYQYEFRVGRAPEFSEGGAFLESVPAPGQDGRPFPYGDVTNGVPTTATTAPAPAAPTVPAAPSAGPAVAAPAAPVDAAPAPVEPVPTAPAPTAPSATPPLPATGTYTYAVTGTEGATGFGNRSFPATATAVVHADPSLATDQLVLDLTLSDQHRERAVLGHRAGGVTFDYEAGSITFGPGTQSSEGTYDPPMVQVPWPLVQGASASGSSATATRVESWTTTVVGQEVLDVLGSPRTTWVVDIQRTTAPGSAEQVDRFRRYWYDPALGTWVRWTERFHGARSMLVTFTYDADYTATLTAFTPG